MSGIECTNTRLLDERKWKPSLSPRIYLCGDCFQQDLNSTTKPTSRHTKKSRIII